MKILDWFRRAEERSLENPAIPISDPRAWELLTSAGYGSAAGVHVSTEAALGVPAVWAAVNFLGDTIASLPLGLFKRTADGGRQAATEDPLHSILHAAPNDELTSFKWRKGAMVSILTKGRALTFVERDPLGRVINLWPLNVDQVVIERVNGRLRYTYRDTDRETVFGASEIVDMAFMMADDGVGHHDPIAQMKNALGLAIALETYAAKFFQAGGVPPLQLIGTFTTPAAAERASYDIGKAISAVRAKGGSVLPLPVNHELKQIGFDPAKGQLTDARRFQIEEIARLYGLPPVFLQDLTRSTFSNTEQQGLHLVKHTLTSWLAAWEQELNLKLFARDRSRFAKFSVDGLLRGDFATRMSGYATAVTNGIRTMDEVRALEDLPPKGGNADELWIQGAMTPISRPLVGDGEPVDEGNDDE